MTVELKWADGEYSFALRGKQIEELQRLCGAGVGQIGQRVMSGNYYWSDIIETIRLGLIGGGLPPVRAKELVDTYVDGCVLARDDDPSSPVATATAIIVATFFGIEKDDDAPEDGEDAGKGLSTSPDSEPPS